MGRSVDGLWTVSGTVCGRPHMNDQILHTFCLEIIEIQEKPETMIILLHASFKNTQIEFRVKDIIALCRSYNFLWES